MTLWHTLYIDSISNYISYTKGNDSQLWNKLVTLPLQLSSPNRHQPPTYQRPPSFALRSARLTRRPPTSDHMIEYSVNIPKQSILCTGFIYICAAESKKILKSTSFPLKLFPWTLKVSKLGRHLYLVGTWAVLPTFRVG